MRSKPCGLLLLCAVSGMLVAGCLSRRGHLAANAIADAQWFSTALKIGNARAAANYLSRAKMAESDLQQALKEHALSLLTADFDSIRPRLTKQNGIWLAT